MHKYLPLLLLLSLLCLAGFTPPAWAAELPDAQMLVSPAYPVSPELAPEGLTPVNSFARANGNVQLRADAAQALQEMLAALKESGVKDIYVSSGYRNFARQAELHTAKVVYYRKQSADEAEALALAARWVLPAGESEHQTGLAVDLSTASVGYNVVPAFADTSAGQWLSAHCVEYGFIIRYTEEKEAVTGVAPEPWHFRYVGVDHAFYMQQNNLCLEEYHALLKEQGLLLFANAQGENRAVHYSAGDTSAALPGQLLAVSLARAGSGEYIITMEPPPEALYDISGHWGEPFIRRLYTMQAMSGYPDGSFRPNSGISRGEFVTVLARLPLPVFLAAKSVAAAEETTEAETAEDPVENLPQGPVLMPYEDIDTGQYYYLPLEKCFQASLVQSLSLLDGQPRLFKPAQPLLRSEAALMLARALAEESFTLPATPSYQDVPQAAGVLYSSVELLTAHGVFLGDGQGSFRPERGVSRAEMSAMLIRLLDSVDEQDTVAEPVEAGLKEEPALKTEN